MDFENIIGQLNRKSILLSGLAQIEDGKRWSVSLRKKNDWTYGYGQGKTVEKAVKAALANLKSHWTDKQWKELKNTPQKQPKVRKRVKLRK